MKENNELERKDIVVDRDMEVDGEIGQEITAYLETWFDVDKNSVRIRRRTTING